MTYEEKKDYFATECNGCGKILEIDKDEFVPIIKNNEPMAFCIKCINNKPLYTITK